MHNAEGFSDSKMFVGRQWSQRLMNKYKNEGNKLDFFIIDWSIERHIIVTSIPKPTFITHTYHALSKDKNLIQRDFGVGLLILNIGHLSSAVYKSKIIIHLVSKGDCGESYVFWLSALQQTWSVLTEVNYL